MSVDDYLYRALLEYTHVLIDIINSLPNAREIKADPKYKKVHEDFTNAMRQHVDERIMEARILQNTIKFPDGEDED